VSFIMEYCTYDAGFIFALVNVFISSKFYILLVTNVIYFLAFLTLYIILLLILILIAVIV